MHLKTLSQLLLSGSQNSQVSVAAYGDLSIDAILYKSAVSTAFVVERIGLKTDSLDGNVAYLFFAHSYCRNAHIIEFKLLVLSAQAVEEKRVASTTFRA